MSPGLTGAAASRRRGLELDTILQAANAWAVKLGHFVAGQGRPSIDPEGHLAPHPARGELLVLGGRLRVVYQLAGDVYVLVVQEPGASVILGATLGNAVLGSLAAAFKGRERGKGKGWEVSAERLHDDFNSTYKAVRRALVMDALPQAERQTAPAAGAALEKAIAEAQANLAFAVDEPGNGWDQAEPAGAGWGRPSTPPGPAETSNGPAAGDDPFAAMQGLDLLGPPPDPAAASVVDPFAAVPMPAPTTAPPQQVADPFAAAVPPSSQAAADPFAAGTIGGDQDPFANAFLDRPLGQPAATGGAADASFGQPFAAFGDDSSDEEGSAASAAGDTLPSFFEASFPAAGSAAAPGAAAFGFGDTGPFTAGASGGFEASFPAELSGQIDDLFARPAAAAGADGQAGALDFFTAAPTAAPPLAQPAPPEPATAPGVFPPPAAAELQPAKVTPEPMQTQLQPPLQPPPPPPSVPAAAATPGGPELVVRERVRGEMRGGRLHAFGCLGEVLCDPGAWRGGPPPSGALTLRWDGQAGFDYLAFDGRRLDRVGAAAFALKPVQPPWAEASGARCALVRYGVRPGPGAAAPAVQGVLTAVPAPGGGCVKVTVRLCTAPAAAAATALTVTLRAAGRPLKASPRAVYGTAEGALRWRLEGAPRGGATLEAVLQHAGPELHAACEYRLTGATKSKARASGGAGGAVRHEVEGLLLLCP